MQSEIFVVLTSSDSGGSLFVAACSSEDRALDIIAKIRSPRWRRDFYIEKHTLDTVDKSYQWMFD